MGGSVIQRGSLQNTRSCSDGCYNFRAIPHNGASAFAERFCPKGKCGKSGNTGCISLFSHCTIGAKDSAKAAVSTQRCCLREALNNSARAGGERFFPNRRFRKRRNTVCISRFLNRTDGEKDPLPSRRRIVQSFLR